MKTNNSNLILIFGFGAILILLAIMASIWLNYIHSTNLVLAKILNEQKTTEHVFNMRDAAYNRTLILHRMTLMEDPFDRDEEYLDFQKFGTQFIAARDNFLKQHIGPEQNEIWERAREQIKKGAASQAASVDHLLNQNDEAAHEVLLTEVTPNQRKGMNELTNLLDLQREKMNKVAQLAQEDASKSYVFGITLGVATFLISIAIAAIVTRSSTRHEKELQQAEQDAMSANQYKSLFLANMSHEIRTPLTAVIGYAETLLDEKLEKNERQEYTSTIIRNGRHLLQIINDILDLSKIEANKLTTEFLQISPLDIILEIESVMGHIAREKGLEFKLQYLFPFPEKITSDPTRLKQILLNITSNAIKFTEIGEVTVNCSFNTNNNKMIFTVSDTGIGMSEEAVGKIFNPFSQADASTTRKFGGTGLGLTISRSLARMLGGDLDCSSQEGKGTIFTLSIDVGDVSQVEQLYALPEGWSSSNQQIKTEAPRVNGKVLLAEDSPDIQRLVTMYLKRTGASVMAVDNGQLAVEAALANDFDLIFMDMQMPVMDGVQATQWLRSTGYMGNIVALTANAMKEDRERYMAAGINGFLAKPIDLVQFYQVIADYLEPGDDSDENLNAHNDDEYMSELTAKFIDGLPALMQEFASAMEAQNAEALRQVAHKLKGMGGSFGYPKITEISAKIENLAKEQLIQDAVPLVQDLDDMCNKIVNG